MTLLEMAGVRELLRLVDVVGNLAEFCALFCEFGLRPDDLIGPEVVARSLWRIDLNPCRTDLAGF